MSAREAAAESPWLIVHEARNARVRLFCFHYAGATASIFRTWPGGLPDWIEVVAVQLPGREYRLGEPLIEHAEPIVEALADIVPPLLDLPYAFFGHSMGALIAFDLAHLLRARGFAQPLLFVASGRSAPRFRWRDAGIQTLADEAFIAAVRDYNGTPEALIADPALRELWLPRLRADLTISATYRYVGPPPLDCPMLVLHGSNDGLVSDAGLSGWLAETIGAVRYVGFSGGHFFMHGEEAGVLAEVRRELERVLARAAQDEPNGMREPAARMSHLTEESGT